MQEKLDTLDELILIERLKRNDRNAYSELFDGYFDKLFTFALNMVFREDVANDIVQEVFIAIYEKSVFTNYKGSLKAYLYTSVRNRCYNYLRDAKVEDRHMALYAEAAVYSDSVDVIDEEEILEKIRQVMDELPDKCREVCLLRFVQGCKYSDIAERLSMNENTVKAQLHRGTEKIKDCFSKTDFTLILFVMSQSCLLEMVARYS